MVKCRSSALRHKVDEDDERDQGREELQGKAMRKDLVDMASTQQHDKGRLEPLHALEICIELGIITNNYWMLLATATVRRINAFDFHYLLCVLDSG